MSKTAYISPAAGELEVTVIRDANPSVTIELDLGIPNFTRFSLKFPLVVDEPKNMATVTQEALGVLLDEVATFMLSLTFDQAVITDIYARALSCFAGMGMDSSTQANFTDVMQDNHIETFEGSFRLPDTFVQEIHNKVITGANNTVKRLPDARKLELSQMVPPGTSIADTQRLIRMYRNRQLKTQPRPLFVMVYDQVGKPTGVIPVQQQWKSKLLQRIQGSEKQADTLWFSQGPNAPNSFTADKAELEHAGERGKHCPGCNGSMPSLKAEIDRENEVTHWTGRCPRCQANLTVFND